MNNQFIRNIQTGMVIGMALAYGIILLVKFLH